MLIMSLSLTLPLPSSLTFPPLPSLCVLAYMVLVMHYEALSLVSINVIDIFLYDLASVLHILFC